MIAAGVWTRSIRRALTMSEQLEACTLWVNTYRAVGYMSLSAAKSAPHRA